MVHLALGADLRQREPAALFVPRPHEIALVWLSVHLDGWLRGPRDRGDSLRREVERSQKPNRLGRLHGPDVVGDGFRGSGSRTTRATLFQVGDQRRQRRRQHFRIHAEVGQVPPGVVHGLAHGPGAADGLEPVGPRVHEPQMTSVEIVVGALALDDVGMCDRHGAFRVHRQDERDAGGGAGIGHAVVGEPGRPGEHDADEPAVLDARQDAPGQDVDPGEVGQLDPGLEYGLERLVVGQQVVSEPVAGSQEGHDARGVFGALDRGIRSVETELAGVLPPDVQVSQHFVDGGFRGPLDLRGQFGRDAPSQCFAGLSVEGVRALHGVRQRHADHGGPDGAVFRETDRRQPGAVRARIRFPTLAEDPVVLELVPGHRVAGSAG